MSKLYRVLGIDELTRINDRGQLEKYYRVEAKTDGGVVFHVEVDAEHSTAEKAAPILEARAKELDGILDL